MTQDRWQVDAATLRLQQGALTAITSGSSDRAFATADNATARHIWGAAAPVTSARGFAMAKKKKAGLAGTISWDNGLWGLCFSGISRGNGAGWCAEIPERLCFYGFL